MDSTPFISGFGRNNNSIFQMKLKKLLAIGDFHIPYQSPEATSLFYKFIKDCQPDWIILLGDFLDCWELSHFRKFPAIDGNDFQNEIERGKEVLAKIVKICPESKIVYIEGNHEFRIKSYLMEKAEKLYNLPSLRLEYLLELHKYPQITFYELRNKSKFSHHFVKQGHLWFGHADISRKDAGYTAKALREEIGINVITGHTHKLAFSPRTYKDGILSGWEAGCMCQLESDYSTINNWQQGWLYIEANQDISQYTIHPILIQDNSFIFNGKIY